MARLREMDRQAAHHRRPARRVALHGRVVLQVGRAARVVGPMVVGPVVGRLDRGAAQAAGPVDLAGHQEALV